MEFFDQTIAKTIPVNGIRGGITVEDLRKEERFAAGRTIQAIHHDRQLSAWLVECSMSGVQIVCDQPIASGQRIELVVKIDGKPTLVPYQVRYWRKVWSDAYQVGAELAETLTPPQHQSLLQELLTPE